MCGKSSYRRKSKTSRTQWIVRDLKLNHSLKFDICPSEVGHISSSSSAAKSLISKSGNRLTMCEIHLLHGFSLASLTYIYLPTPYPAGRSLVRPVHPSVRPSDLSASSQPEAAAAAGCMMHFAPAAAAAPRRRRKRLESALSGMDSCLAASDQ